MHSKGRSSHGEICKHPQRARTEARETFLRFGWFMRFSGVFPSGTWAALIAFFPQNPGSGWAGSSVDRRNGVLKGFLFLFIESARCSHSSWDRHSTLARASRCLFLGFEFFRFWLWGAAQRRRGILGFAHPSFGLGTCTGTGTEG